MIVKSRWNVKLKRMRRKSKNYINEITRYLITFHIGDDGDDGDDW